MPCLRMIEVPLWLTRLSAASYTDRLNGRFKKKIISALLQFVLFIVLFDSCLQEV